MGQKPSGWNRRLGKALVVCWGLAGLVLAACASPPLPVQESPAPVASLTASATFAPRTVVSSAVTPSPPLPTASPTSATPLRPKYVLQATVDIPAKTVAVQERILYPNTSTAALEELVLAVEPNLLPGGFVLQRLTVNDQPVEPALKGQRLTVPLPSSLAPGEWATVEMAYTLVLPRIRRVNPDKKRPPIYGFTSRQVNLVNWYPFVVPYDPAQGWVLHSPWYYGEHLVYPLADVEVRLRVTAEEPWMVAASALPEPDGEGWRYRLLAGRTFVLSLNSGAQVLEEEWQGVQLRSVFFPAYAEGGAEVLRAMKQALTIYVRHFGPYPHLSLTAVMGDFDDGMEYSAFFFLPRNFYDLYDGTPKGYLTFIAAHETAHQWWFERVANDQALHPWMDEAPATYSERLFYEAVNPDWVPWWWAYRVDFYEPEGWIDIPVYEGRGYRRYVNAVYLRGAHFFEDLRQTMGDEAFFAFLRAYQARMNGQIAAPEDFFALLGAYTDQELTSLLATYFREPPISPQRPSPSR